MQNASTHFDIALAPAKTEAELVAGFYENPVIDANHEGRYEQIANELCRAAQQAGQANFVENIMATYSLETAAGRSMMELAEALLRVPDKHTRNVLISDKIGGQNWKLDNLSIAMRCVGGIMRLGGGLSRWQPRHHWLAPINLAVKALIRYATLASMRLLGQNFIFATSIDKALRNRLSTGNEGYSFDMLGEAARTRDVAEHYFNVYMQAIEALGVQASAGDPHQNDGVSIKLSALHPRYQTRYWPTLESELLPKLKALVLRAAELNIPVNIDAEEAARLELSLAIFEHVFVQSELEAWAGFGMVVQAYNRNTTEVLKFLAALAERKNKRIPIRLVKGAYWDAEIKTAQVLAKADFPVFTSKHHTDLAYLDAARYMLNNPWIYPQFATHNAATLAVIETLAQSMENPVFEVQRLHGMGKGLYAHYSKRFKRRSRIYAPVGGHEQLLAYLVRRLLENGANASFINKIHDPNTPLEQLAANPYQQKGGHNDWLKTGEQLFLPRRNSQGWDIDSPSTLKQLRLQIQQVQTAALPTPQAADLSAIDDAFSRSKTHRLWPQLNVEQRANIIVEFSNLLENASSEIFALLIEEAGKTIEDCVAELREAVDFCRYYAAAATQGDAPIARGTVLAISPWNFPLAIFLGQITAALCAGNKVIAKPAEQTPRIAELAHHLLLKAGVPSDACILIQGTGKAVGAALVETGDADMIVFTGSTVTAKQIELSIAKSKNPMISFIAETGGLNAMVLDATALLERAVDDIIRSAYQSAGQRCSALRMLYVQEDIYDSLVEMLIGAASTLKIGTACEFDTDVGSVIDQAAAQKINHYLEQMRTENCLIWQASNTASKLHIAPALIKVRGIEQLEEEIFGPVLHIATYAAGAEAEVITAINQKGFGLTFGLHSRIDSKQRFIAEHVSCGNIYINRDQIGAIVGSQPFGGHGLSGTGPKAGGANYLRAFSRNCEPVISNAQLPGPDGESNQYKIKQKSTILALESMQTLLEQTDFTAVQAIRIRQKNGLDLNALRLHVASHSDRIIPWIHDPGSEVFGFEELHCCTDLTAAGGNSELLSKVR